MSFKEENNLTQNKLYSSKNSSFQHQSQTSISSRNLSSLQLNSTTILKNTQFLTHLQNYLTIKILYKQLNLPEAYEYIDIRSLCKVIIQNIYLLQICYMFQLKVYISQQFYIQKAKYSSNSHNINIFKLFCFECQLNQEIKGINMKKMMLNKKFYKIFQYEQNKLQDYFLVLQNFVSIIQQYFQNFENNQKKPTSSPQNVQLQMNRKCLIQFANIYKKLILPQKKRFRDPKSLLKILEQTKLFRFHGILLKITKSSLLYSIKNSPIQIKEQLIQSTQHLKSLFDHNNQLQIIPKQKQIQKYIDYVFGYLCRNNLIQITKSLKTVVTQQQQLDYQALSLFEYEESTVPLCPVMTATILIPQKRYLTISEDLLEKILSDQSLDQCQQQKDCQPQKNLGIEVSYTFLKNEIKVKCLTQIDITIQNMDYINYLIAAFNQGMKSSIVIDTIDKFRKSASKRKQKVIVFKLTSRLNFNQQPLTKILESIDVSMLACRIFMSQLTKKSFIKLEDQDKKEKICQIYKHYENILRNVMRKFYSEIENSKQ